MPPDPIDNLGLSIRSGDFTGMAYLKPGESGPPLATPSKDFSTTELDVRTGSAFLTSFTHEGQARGEETRTFDWNFGRRTSDGHRSLHAEFTCRSDGCERLERALRTAELVDERR